MFSMNCLCGGVVFGHKHMPAALPTSAATGGLVAALVSNYLSSDLWLNPAGPVAPLCQELIRDPTWHVPSLLIGIILGIFLAQLLDFSIWLGNLFSSTFASGAGTSTTLGWSRLALHEC